MPAAEVTIDARLFHRRARGLVNHWRNSNGPEDSFQNVGTLLVILGNIGEEDNIYQKTTAMQTWLFGYELTQTLMLFTPDTLHVVTGGNKAKILETLKQWEGPQFPIELHVRGKDEAHNEEVLKRLVKIIASHGDRVGVFAKDTQRGAFAASWKAALDSSDKPIESVDMSTGVAEVFAIKDDEELRSTKMAAKLSSLVMRNYFIEEMSKIIDEERKITHEKLADKMEAALMDEKMYKQLKFPADVRNPEWCYTPIIQSGGDYDLKTSAVSNEKELHAGAIICSLGVRYRSYCSNIGRTFLIDANKTQEKNYAFLLDVQRKVLDAMKEGVLIKDVFNRAVDFIRNRRPDLEKKFVKNLGFGTGLEFRESSYLLNGKNTKELQSDMIFSLSVGFQDIENPKATDEKSKKYSLLLVDTIRITTEAPQILTSCDTSFDDISYILKDVAEEEEEPVKKEQPNSQRTAKSAVLNTKFRSEQEEASKDQARKEHQKMLAEQKHAEGLERYGDAGSLKKDNQKSVFRKFESYKRESALPKEVSSLRIVVDQRNDTLVLPIYGLAVPFHISTLQKVTKTDEGEFFYLRLNFITPGQPGKKDDTPFDDPNANFVRALSFRSADGARMSEIYNQIMEMKKNAVKKESERKEMADIVEQDKLIEAKGKRPPRLPDVFARPGLDGKRPGELEIHSNGLRYVSPLRNENRIDILFNNIKHLFFQPCDGELIVLIHCQLKNPILIGKKKTEHVQFYREASDAQFDETGNRRRKYVYGDEDELASEQEERKRRAALNKEFKLFGEKITELSENKVEVDVPFRDLAFNGVPFRTNVLLKPTQDCLVHLSEAPFLVVTLADVEIVHLERVQFGLKNFDMVFTFKDYFQQPIHINTIPMSQLDNVKDWLDSMDIVFYEGPVNLNWGPIMKTIQEDPAEFYREGGWSFLAIESDAEDSDESGSEFEASESDFESSSSESSYASDASMDDGSEEEASDEESGEDWDALEEKAKRGNVNCL
ncbi:putative SPT16-general chromatin factor [Gamsiella multidivaricata]|uniref:putative SPT16-general chromatin factor n=1 Tax=Gamsiella multidivaricata TaxID=101098 RepID=UPI00221FA7E6|nr:putative SPT16-general chromatin factor [Gamsiella multidivaricata]KAI7820538.1 putative SPT16-general chromatin factor [Gamsiella multidivaricata]